MSTKIGIRILALNQLKECQKCKETKDIEQFSLRNKNGTIRHTTCKKCQREYNREHYRNNRDRYRERNIRTRNKIIKWYREYKKTLECNVCGENHPACLEFHHKNPIDKKYNISHMMVFSTKNRIIEEISKCVVLCANCHRKHHYNGV